MNKKNKKLGLKDYILRSCRFYQSYPLKTSLQKCTSAKKRTIRIYNIEKTKKYLIGLTNILSEIFISHIQS